ncbi:MAG TPA: hypothetical protein VNM37_27405, partial [Candidatus Dormibacteraeota bacterium]|nr:hypothetical protein [Candidatus Dormibacteraeota bacterium]
QSQNQPGPALLSLSADARHLEESFRFHLRFTNPIRENAYAHVTDHRDKQWATQVLLQCLEFLPSPNI